MLRARSELSGAENSIVEAATLAAQYSVIDLMNSLQAGEKDPVTILVSVAKLFDADGASLFLLDPVTSDFVLAAATGTSKRIPNGTRIELASGVAGRAIAKGQAILLNDAHPIHGDVDSSIVIPLAVVGSHPMGVLNLSRSAHAEPYVADDVSLATTVSTTLTFLFQGAYLLQRVEAGQQKLEAILSGLSIETFLFDANGNLVSTSHPNAEVLLFDHHVEEAIASLRAEANVKKSVARHRLNSEIGAHASKVLDIAVIPLPEGGYGVTIEDISREVTLQQSLEQSRRLAEIGKMTATIAHEIRNPLTSLRAVGQMIASGESSEEFGEMIQDEVAKLTDLCDQFLDFAKPLSLELRDCSLQSILCPLVASCQVDAKATGVELELFESIDAEGKLMRLDANRIEQAARNLILNAIQAMPNGGKVSVIVTGQGFTIADTGPGMAPEILGNLFTPFFTTKAKGTGLGLARVKKIIEAHLGTIEVKSSAAGTEFTVRL